MALVNMKEMLLKAREGKYAVGQFNINNVEWTAAILDKAQELNAPVILGVTSGAATYMGGWHTVVGLVRGLIIDHNITVPVALHVDHGGSFEICKAAIDAGFTSVMIDGSHFPLEENIRVVKEVVDYAHLHNVEVEAELGALPNRESSTDSNIKKENLYTKVELVNDFINRTNIDALAIAFGTAHGLYKSKPILNMDVISNVRKVTDIPLVMHGGSGISFDQYKEVIKRGINKINYYTYMSYAGYEKAKQYIKENESDYLHNLSWQTMLAMKENVKETMKIFANIDD